VTFLPAADGAAGPAAAAPAVGAAAAAAVVVYPIPVDPPLVPSDNPTGCYRHTFDIQGYNTDDR